MSKGKNYNSIVFLTTLSVYLGLVLVGGAIPTVLAQAALTRDFDIKNEIVFEDDLDKKPDDDEIKLSGPTGGYFDDLESLIEDLQKLHKIEKFDLDYDSFRFEESQIVKCNLETIRNAAISSNIDKVNNRWLIPAIVDATYNFEGYGFLGDCLPNDKFNKKNAVTYELKVNYDKAEFKFELSVIKESPQKAKQLAEKFNQALDVYKVDDEEVIIKQIYENTTFSSENNQVFIVTRLPRGSLNTLLAEKDAQ